MQFLTQEQKRVLDDFVKCTGELIQSGMSYSFANGSYMKNFDCHEKQIELLNSFKKTDPKRRKCYDKMLQQEYFRYIMKLIRAGLKYVKHNPKYMNKFIEAQNVLGDYGRLMLNKSNVQSRQATPVYKKPVIETSTDEDDPFSEIYRQMNHLNTTIDELQNRTSRLSQEYATPKQIRRTTVDLNKFDEEITNKLNNIQNAKKIRMQEYERSQKYEPVATRRVLDYQLEDDDDDSCSQEIIVKKETYNKPQQNQYPKSKPQQQQYPRLGRIQRNVTIPVHVDDKSKVPNIKSWVDFEESNDGILRLNVHLEFDEKVWCNDKLLNKVKIRNYMTT